LTSQAGAGRSSAGSFPDGVLAVLDCNPLPALIVEVSSERILALSQAALALFSDQGSELVGRTVESLGVGIPPGALELLVEGRLVGFETVHQLRLVDGSLVPLQTWVRTIGDMPLQHVLLVFTLPGKAMRSAGSVLVSELGAVIGTTDARLMIDGLTGDLDATVNGTRKELLGQSIFEIVGAADVAGLVWAVAQTTSTGKGVALPVNMGRAIGQPQQCLMLLLPKNPAPSFIFGLMSPMRPEAASESELGALWDETRGDDIFRVSRDLAALAVAVPGLAELSPRELDVLTRLLAGRRVPAIARVLFISQSTVRNHLSSVFRKLGVESQQELIDLLRQKSGHTV